MLTLTETEIEELTRRHRVDARRRALDAMRIPYRVRHDGTLVVLRVDIEQRPAEVKPAREPQLRL